MTCPVLASTLYAQAPLRYLRIAARAVRATCWWPTCGGERTEAAGVVSEKGSAGSLRHTRTLPKSAAAAR